MTTPLLRRAVAGALLCSTLVGTAVFASSHMDAPLATFDPPANTTDVYAFVDQDGGAKNLVVALGVYPFEEPGIGPNKLNFDDDVLYEIHVALGNDVKAGRASVSYQFQFATGFKNENTILQSYLGRIENIGDNNQNLTQTYSVTKIDHRRNTRVFLGYGTVPPNNQGAATPYYNQNDDGDQPARAGVATEGELDRYTAQAVARLNRGYVAFAGQRDDGFYADIEAVFDFLRLRNPGKDNQAGYNLHLMALEIPLSELGGDRQLVGVYATTSRRQVTVLRSPENGGDIVAGRWIQVARQGNPLFNEGLVAIADKDLYSRTSPTRDRELFRKYAENPELAKLLNLLVIPGTGLKPAVETGRTDIAGIYIPDLIKVDLSTPGVRFAGGGPNNSANPDDAGYSRLGVFGGDVLKSQIQDPFGNGGFVPGGWPNGRRFGDDVVDIAVTALISDLRTLPLFIQGPAGDNVNANDVAFNKVFPYESTPHNGRIHRHHGD